jgi:hypothetical protein
MDSGSAQSESPVGVILRDGGGNYYAIPGRTLAEFQVPANSRHRVEAFLIGDEPISLPSFDDSARMLHTTRRSYELWLVLT